MSTPVNLRRFVAVVLFAWLALGALVQPAGVLRAGMVIDPYRFTAVSGSFNPADYGTVLGDWDGVAQTGYVDNDAAGTWTDFSGNSRDATNSDSGEKPLYKTGIINGKPVFRFDGSNDCLFTPSFSQPQYFTMFVVCRFTRSPPFNELVVSTDNFSSARHCQFWATPDGTKATGVPFGPAFPEVTGDLTAWHVGCLINRSGSSQMYYNGTAGSTAGAGSPISQLDAT